MKRRRGKAPLPLPECQSAPRLARRHSSGAFSGDYHCEGILLDAVIVFYELPIEPQETSVFTEPALLKCAPASAMSHADCTSLSISKLSEFANPCYPFTFEVTSSLPYTSGCWEAVSRNLRIAASFAGDTQPAVSLKASTAFKILPKSDGVRITIAPGWWSDSASFTLDGLYHAGHVVGTPLLPATISVVNVKKYAPCKMGHLWRRSRAGDAAGVSSAIKKGCSTEESDEKVTKR